MDHFVEFALKQQFNLPGTKEDPSFVNALFQAVTGDDCVSGSGTGTNIPSSLSDTIGYRTYYLNTFFSDACRSICPIQFCEDSSCPFPYDLCFMSCANAWVKLFSILF